MVGATLKTLILSGHFGPGDLLKRIEQAFECFMNSDERKRDTHLPAPWTVRRLRFYQRRFPMVGATYKHGQVRAFLHVAAAQAQIALKPTSPNSFRLMVTCVSTLDAFVQLLDSRGAILNENDRSQAFELGRVFRNSYTALVCMSRLRNDYYWSMTGKAHQFDHVIDHLKISAFNPLYQFACWQEETFMGVTAQVTRRVTAMSVGLARALERYVVWLHAEYDGVEDEQ